MTPFVFEPIPAFGAMMLAFRMAKLQDGPLGPDVAALDARAKAARASDTTAWLQVYREAVLLIPRVLQHYGPPESGPQKAAVISPQRVASALNNALNGLSRAPNDWSGRLSQQEKDLMRGVTAAVEKLQVVSTVDDAHGEMVFTYDPKELDAFWGWLGDAERAWSANNGKLVAVRAQEMVAAELADLPPEMQFEIAPASIQPAPPAPARLKGHRIPNPGFFQSLGTTYRFIMGGVGAVSGLGFILTSQLRNATSQQGATSSPPQQDSMVGSVQHVVPFVLATVFIGALIVAAVTIPKQRRQNDARLRMRARDEVERELLGAVQSRLRSAADAQMATVKKHLAAETTRLKTTLRAHAPAGDVMGVGAPLPTGLLPTDLAKLRGEWKSAIEARVREIEATAAGTGAST